MCDSHVAGSGRTAATWLDRAAPQCAVVSVQRGVQYLRRERLFLFVPLPVFGVPWHLGLAPPTRAPAAARPRFYPPCLSLSAAQTATSADVSPTSQHRAIICSRFAPCRITADRTRVCVGVRS